MSALRLCMCAEFTLEYSAFHIVGTFHNNPHRTVMCTSHAHNDTIRMWSLHVLFLDTRYVVCVCVLFFFCYTWFIFFTWNLLPDVFPFTCRVCGFIYRCGCLAWIILFLDRIFLTWCHMFLTWVQTGFSWHVQYQGRIWWNARSCVFQI